MKFIAHRGLDNHKYKENSIDAFRFCFNCSYIDGVEMDVRITKDNRIVLSHSEYYKKYLISRTKYKRLHLDLLEDVLNIASDKIIVIDIKGNYSILKYLYRVLAKYDLNYYLCSFNYDVVNMIYDMNLYRVGLIIGYMINIEHLKNCFNFCSLHYNLIRRCPKNKVCFIWTVNSVSVFNFVKKYGDGFYIITDKTYLLRGLG